MREVFETLEVLGVRYFVTGSEAAAVYGSLRQTFDTDVVIDLKPSRFGTIDQALGGAYVVNEPIDYGDFSMASLISIDTAAKVDLIMCVRSPWADAAMARRHSAEHPTLGNVWVAAIEDLILAKLMWSEGTSELHLRDCGTLIRINRDEIDWPYMQRWAAVLEVAELLARVRDAP
jgi:hypothetical protein